VAVELVESTRTRSRCLDHRLRHSHSPGWLQSRSWTLCRKNTATNIVHDGVEDESGGTTTVVSKTDAIAAGGCPIARDDRC